MSNKHTLVVFHRSMDQMFMSFRRGPELPGPPLAAPLPKGDSGQMKYIKNKHNSFFKTLSRDISNR